MKKSLFFLVFFVLVSGFFSTIQAKTLVVDNNPTCIPLINICWSCEGTFSFYKTISLALDNANNGDTIKICKGNYNESDIITQNDLTIEGGANVSVPTDVKWESNSNTLTIGSYSNPSDNVTIRNLSLEMTGSKNNYALMLLNGENVNIDNVYIKSRGGGISGGWSFGGDNVFENLNITAKTNGISINKGAKQTFENDNITIDGNNANYYGIYLGSSVQNASHIFKNLKIDVKKQTAINISHSSNISFENININASNYNSDYRDAIYLGWGVDGGSNFNFKNVNISLNKGEGVDIKKANDITFDNVSIKGSSGYGIYLDSNVEGKLTFKHLSINANKGYGVDIENGNGFDMEEANITGVSGTGYDVFCDWGMHGNYYFKNVNASTSSYGFIIRKANDVTFDNLTLKGNSPNGNYWGIYGDSNVNGTFKILNSDINVTGIAVYLNSGMPDIENSKIVSQKNHALYFSTSTSKVTLKNNCISKEATNNYYDIYIYNWKANAQVETNCIYGSPINTLAKAESSGNDFNGNYWYGLPAGQIYNYNNVIDNNPLTNCPLTCVSSNIPKPVIDYHMDACEWDNDSSTYEIKNYGSLGSDYNATALNGANTIPNGKICRGGNFEGKYIELHNYPYIGRRWSMSVWIKFPLTPTANQFQWENYYYFVIATVDGTGDLGYFARRKNGSNYKWGVYDNNGNINEINLGNIRSGWHHIVEVVKRRKTFLYIDGNYIGNVNIYTHGDLKYIGSSTDYINDETIGSYMDEFELYDTALTANQIQQIYNNENAGKNYNGTPRTCPVCVAIDHYEIWHYPTNLTCQPAPLEIKACANDNCSQLYTDNVTLTLDYDSESKEISFSGGEDNTTISYTQAGTITLSTSNESPTPSNPTICHIFNSSSTSCDITFKNTGFVFKTPTNSNYVLNNMPSCSAKPIEIDAVQKDNVTNKCTNMSVFNGDVTLNMYGRYITPSTNPYGTKVMIDNTSVETVDNNSTATGTSLTLHFDNGTAQFNLSYPDAGSIEIGAIYDENGLKVEGESNPFVVKPARFVFDNLSNPADNSTCSTDSCWANIGVFKKAGEIFNFDVKAICDNGTVTPNYYPINQNGDNSTVNLTALMVAPDNGTDVTNKLSKTAISASEFSGGSASVRESFGEVGVIDLKAIDSNYLGAGSIGADKKVGRFIPHHFVIDNITNGTLKEQCDSFNYIGQTTTYDTKPSFYVIAENKDNQTTLNYKGYFFKLKASDIKIENPQHDDNKTQVNIEIERATPDFKKENGVGTYTFGSDNITYVKDNNSKIAPFSPEFHFSIDNATDSDNVTCANCPDNVSVTGTQMKYGRLKIFNNYGPGNEALTLKVQTQYWNGVQWELNGDDVCTILDSSDFVLENPTGNLLDNDTSISSVKGIDTGEGSLTLSPPGLDKYGSIDADLSNRAIFYNWLYDNNTKGTAFFGIYRGRDRVIEWKEVAP